MSEIITQDNSTITSDNSKLRFSAPTAWNSPSKDLHSHFSQSLCKNSRVCGRHICFVPSFMAAEKRALLSLHLHFVAQYKFLLLLLLLIQDMQITTFDNID